MNSNEKFGILLCGMASEDMYEFQKIMKNLSFKISTFTEIITTYDWSCDKASIELPFLGRNVLESALTALLGRLDPFRLITVYKVQSDASYDLGKKAESAVEWSGDILAKSKKTNLWYFENKKESFDRALLGNHVGEILWKPAFRALNDHIGSYSLSYDSDWLNEILTKTENANFERAKSDAGKLFSSFSKGVHSECLVEINSILDIVTLKSLVKDMYKLCSTLGLVSHFIGFMAPKLECDVALDAFLKIEEMIQDV